VFPSWAGRGGTKRSRCVRTDRCGVTEARKPEAARARSRSLLGRTCSFKPAWGPNVRRREHISSSDPFQYSVLGKWFHVAAKASWIRNKKKSLAKTWQST
jgi:hypothetical protein